MPRIVPRIERPTIVSGGTRTEDALYEYHAYAAGADTLTVISPGHIDVVIVGGGGGGGGYYSGGGGGAGDITVLYWM